MLDEKLANYIRSDIYPFHMPGHKRQPFTNWNPYQMDITEIEGFDNLHHAKEILLDAQMRAAHLYGVKRSFYLVNGSTCGILAAICATTERRKRILIARNCHKSVYHAVYLQELSVDYLYPYITDVGILGQISPDALKKQLEAADRNGTIREVAAVVITSPTYEGVVSDIRQLAEIVHTYGILLIVDEAHGAHFGFSEYFPVSAVSLGADIVIQSLHKTLPSFTQTALLHICTDRTNEHEIARYLDIFETSSPSYLFMAGIEACVHMLEEEGEVLFRKYGKRLKDFYHQMEKLHYLKVMQKSDFSPEEAYDIDMSKICISTDASNMTGKELYDLLLDKYGLQMEMVSGGYVLALSSIMDTDKGFERLKEALLEIDAGLVPADREKRDCFIKMGKLYTGQERVCGIAEAQDAPRKALSLADAKGEICASYVYLYPPGIPIIVPGERITDQFISAIRNCGHLGLEIFGLTSDQGIEVVNFS